MSIKSRDLAIAIGAIGLISVAIPVADSITSLIQTGLNYLTNSIAIRNSFNTHNAEVILDGGGCEEQCCRTQAIGFDTNIEDEEEYDDCEDRRIGF